jgi:serine/threonine protein kinase
LLLLLTKEINIGSLLGQGEFGDVFDISSFQKEWGHCDCLRCYETNPKRGSRKRVNASQQDDDAEGCKPLKKIGSIVDFAELAQTADSNDTIIYVPTRSAATATKGVDETDAVISPIQLVKAYMKAHCVREGAPRFALKRVKSDTEGTSPLWMLGATLDLAKEAKFLASLNHPNIIKMRGTMGKPGHTDFAIVLDRMVTTLDKTIDQWKRELKSRKYTLNIARTLRDGRALELKRLLVMYDISSAVQYLHRNK